MFTLAAGLTFLVGVSLDYPQLLRLALPKTLHARISSVSYCTYFYEFNSDIVYVQNLPRKYMCLKKLPGLLRGGVGWGLGTMFARQGDTLTEKRLILPTGNPQF